MPLYTDTMGLIVGTDSDQFSFDNLININWAKLEQEFMERGVNVDWFHDPEMGSDDHTEAFLRAQATNKMVFVPDKTYYITEQINLNQFYGYGRVLLNGRPLDMVDPTRNLNELRMQIDNVYYDLSVNSDLLADATARLQEVVKKTDRGVLTLDVFDENTRRVLQGLATGSVNAVLGAKNVKATNIDDNAVEVRHINKGANNTVLTHRMLVENIDTRTTEVTRVDGKVTKIEEKDGTTVLKTTTYTYNAEGLVDTFTTAVGSQRIKATVIRSNGEVVRITKEVI